MTYVPDDPESNFQLARCAQILGRHAEAKRHYELVLQCEIVGHKAPYFYGESHNNLGVLYDRDGQHEQAIAHYKKAVEHKPGSAEAHYNLGVGLQGQRNFEAALRALNAALALQPHFPQAQFRRGMVYDHLGLRRRALADYRAVLDSEVFWLKFAGKISPAWHPFSQASLRFSLNQDTQQTDEAWREILRGAFPEFDI